MHSCQDKKIMREMKRILTIWLERGVYKKTVVKRLMKCCCDQSGFGVGEIESHTPEGDPPDSDHEDGTASAAVSTAAFSTTPPFVENSLTEPCPENPPDPEDALG